MAHKKALDAMGESMLKGWKLLGTVCPMEGCNTTLLESPSGDEVFCHSCRAPVVVSAPSGTLNTKEDISERRYEASKMIGDRLLSGWTLLDRDCPKRGCVGVPLLRCPDTQLEECVSCGPLATESADVDITQKDVSIGTTNESQRGEDQSVELSRHLLLGWAMLAELCPDCSSPLMRSKEEKVMCVQPACARREAAKPEEEDGEGGGEEDVWGDALEAISTGIASLADSLETTNSKTVASVSRAIASLALAAKPLLALSGEEDRPLAAALKSALAALSRRAKTESSYVVVVFDSDCSDIESAAVRIRALADAALTLEDLLKTCRA